mmetsp:Transcript_88103/g.156203  ORF Transcript_88103/g.156203 Transcript_88103/m.156203 type:complete len:181 (-) Transcript_88103:894-1436(-)
MNASLCLELSRGNSDSSSFLPEGLFTAKASQQGSVASAGQIAADGDALVGCGMASSVRDDSGAGLITPHTRPALLANSSPSPGREESSLLLASGTWPVAKQDMAVGLKEVPTGQAATCTMLKLQPLCSSSRRSAGAATIISTLGMASNTCRRNTSPSPNQLNCPTRVTQARTLHGSRCSR